MNEKNIVTSSPIKIGMIFNHNVILGGGEISFFDLICGLDKTKWTPIVWVPEDGEIKQKLEKKGVETRIFHFPSLRKSMFFNFFRLVLQLKKNFIKEQISLVHINGARAMLYAGLAAKLARIPVIWHVRVLERDRWLDKIRGAFASIIIANSHSVAKSLKPYRRNKKCYVVYNGIKLEEWRNAEKADLKGNFGIPETSPVILYAGRLSRLKEIHILIEACAKIKALGLSFRLLIVGEPDKSDPNYELFLKKLVAERSLSQETIFAGWQDDIPSIMKSSSVLVLPSNNESFGRVVIEAWAAGLPVIATKGGGPAEIITENEDGLLFEIGNIDELAAKLALVLRDKSLVSSLIKNGQKRAQEFSLQKHIDNVVAIYQELLERNA